MKKLYLLFFFAVSISFLMLGCSETSTNTIGPVSDGDVSVDGDVAAEDEAMEQETEQEVIAEGEDSVDTVVEEEVADEEVVDGDVAEQEAEQEVVVDGDEEVPTESEVEFEPDVVDESVAEEEVDGPTVARFFGIIRVASEELHQQNFDSVIVALFDRVPFQDDDTDALVETTLTASEFSCEPESGICSANYELVWHQAGNFYLYAGLMVHDEDGHLIDMPRRIYAHNSDPIYYDPQGDDVEYNMYLGADANQFDEGVTLLGRMYINEDYADDGNTFVVVLSDQPFSNDTFRPVQMQVFGVNDLLSTGSDKDMPTGPFVQYKFTGIPTDRQWYVAGLLIEEGDSDPSDATLIGPMSLSNGSTHENLFLGVPNPDLGSIEGVLHFTVAPHMGHVVMVMASTRWPVPQDGSTDWLAGSFSKIIDSDDTDIPYGIYNLESGTYYVFAMMIIPGVQEPYMAMPNPVAVNIQIPNSQHAENIDLQMYNARIYGDFVLNVADASFEPGQVIIRVSAIENPTEEDHVIVAFCRAVVELVSDGEFETTYSSAYEVHCGAPGYTHVVSACLDMDRNMKCEENAGDIVIPTEPPFFVFPFEQVEFEQDLYSSYPIPE